MSVRARLTASFTALFGTIVIAMGISTYLLVKNNAYLRLDAALEVAASATAMSAQHELNEHPTKLGGERDIQLVLEETGTRALGDTQILVREGRREAAFKPESKPAFDIRHLPLSVLAGTATVNGYRVTTRMFRSEKFGTDYRIYVAKPINPVIAQLRGIRTGLFIFVPIGLALAGLAGYLLAQRSLRPLQRLADTVDAVTSSDLSARVRMDNEGDEIGTLGVRFNSLLARLEQAFRVQRQFMADASHQIRTPVTVALTAAQVTMRDPNVGVCDCKESLGLVEHQMLQLRRIVEDMFFLSQSDAGPLRIERRPIYLDDAVSDAVRAAAALAKPKRQSVSLGPLPEARCLGDTDLLKQALLVLLDNAVKFTPLGGNIGVELSREGSDWVCRVSDDGVGICPSAQPRIFERFFRENKPGNESMAGSGLGLTIAQSIVESHGGNVVLAGSRAGQTTFQMLIPALDEEATEEIQANSLAVSM